MDTRRQCTSRRRLAPLSLSFFAILALLLQTTAVRAAFTNNFDAYPSGSRSCLNSSATASGCDGDNVTAMNECLCSNTGNFVISAAECIGKSDYADLETVYTTMASACSFSNTPLTVSQRDFLSAGNGTYTSTTSKPSTTTSGGTSTPSLTTITTTSNGHVETITSTAGVPQNTSGSDSNNSSDGMSSTTKTGIIAGATVAGVAIVAVFAFFLIRMWRNRQPTEEHRPMLGGSDNGHGGGGGGGSQVSGTELTHLSSVGGSTYDWKAGAVPGSEAGDGKWPHDPYNTSPSPNMLYQQQSGGVYELPVQDAQQPVEMPATPMVSGASPAYHHPQGQPTEYSSAYR